ncbi:hypothetical protein CLOM_g18075 [Closterium sp. NIES-68]|nr:hypothetical protein CLOM_g18075 [Closterium sp. NIES-68]GJP65550.1 hypothetical protein CLOP_g22427 [Closterium sp. NIES-67]
MSPSARSLASHDQRLRLPLSAMGPRVAGMPSLAARLFLLACLALLLPLSHGKWVSHLPSYQAYEQRLSLAEKSTTWTITKEVTDDSVDSVYSTEEAAYSNEVTQESSRQSAPSRPSASPLLRGSALVAAAAAESLSRGTREAADARLARVATAAERERKAEGGEWDEEGGGRSAM